MPITVAGRMVKNKRLGKSRRDSPVAGFSNEFESSAFVSLPRLLFSFLNTALSQPITLKNTQSPPTPALFSYFFVNVT